MFSIVVAGVLALPSLLLTVVMAPVIAILSIPSVYLLLAKKKACKKFSSDQPKQIIITGGSSGIGLSIACEAAADSSVSRIVILARNKERLEKAKAEILAKAAAAAADDDDKKKVEAVSVDVTDPEAVKNAAVSIMRDSSEMKTHLFCCAGEPHPAYFQDISPQAYANIVQTNQLGSIYITNAFLSFMKSGTVTLCSSMGGQLGVFGFTAYSPTKFALRGFAECLHMELSNNPEISVQVAYPPDTDTPGFEKENIGKPEETRLVSETAGLSCPKFVGKIMLREALAQNPRFNVYFTFDGWLLSTLTAGFSPVTTLSDGIAQISIMCLSRWISLFYLADWHRIIQNYQLKHPRRETNNVDSASKSSGSVKED